ncbi:MAG: hypothetical protein OEZ68_18800 [Gammaproteobacteria bacterium]|nr:hypothetical protein [Gammaproteobacteria bacterium]MDH5802856.1 hypothetical protein [Gammaproteobacteria bacterium]
MPGRILLSIVEQGGYPDFSALYERCDYQVTILRNMRKAISFLKKNQPHVIVAEFNHQSDFRDRTSSLESLLATLQKMSQHSKTAVKVLVFYEKDYRQQLQKLQTVFDDFTPMAYPIREEELAKALQDMV